MKTTWSLFAMSLDGVEGGGRREQTYWREKCNIPLLLFFSHPLSSLSTLLFFVGMKETSHWPRWKRSRWEGKLVSTQIHLCSFLFSENTITVIRLIPTPIERWVSLSLSLSTKFILKVYWEVLNHIPVVQLCKWSIFVPWSLPQKAKKKKQTQRKNHLYLK